MTSQTRCLRLAESFIAIRKCDTLRGNIVLAVFVAVGVLVPPSDAGGDPPPRRAFAPIALHPLPLQAIRQCRAIQAQAAFAVLCPQRVPLPTVAPPRGRLPPLRALRASDLLDRARVSGVNFVYSAPWEPDSGPGWQQHAWRNRPCCFLHFEVFRRPDRSAYIPAGARPARLGGKRGLLAEASGYGLGHGAAALYAGNHDRFLFRLHGVPYVASLHYFGRKPTLDLLARLLRQLRPARDLRRFGE